MAATEDGVHSLMSVSGSCKHESDFWMLGVGPFRARFRVGAASLKLGGTCREYQEMRGVPSKNIFEKSGVLFWNIRESCAISRILLQDTVVVT